MHLCTDPRQITFQQIISFCKLNDALSPQVSFTEPPTNTLNPSRHPLIPPLSPTSVAQPLIIEIYIVKILHIAHYVFEYSNNFPYKYVFRHLLISIFSYKYIWTLARIIFWYKYIWTFANVEIFTNVTLCFGPFFCVLPNSDSDFMDWLAFSGVNLVGCFCLGVMGGRELEGVEQCWEYPPPPSIHTTSNHH